MIESNCNDNYNDNCNDKLRLESEVLIERKAIKINFSLGFGFQFERSSAIECSERGATFGSEKPHLNGIL